MRLHGLVYYRGNSDTWTDDWEDNDYRSWALTKAVKHADFNGNYRVAHDGTTYKISNTEAGRANALKLAAAALVRRIIKAGYMEATMIAIPSSDHIAPGMDFTAYRLAQAISEADSDYLPLSALHFHMAMKKSAGGGTRNPYIIEKNLRLSGLKLPSKAILIDDVCTTGAHLKAAKWFLESHGVSVEDAFVVARTVKDRPAHMMRMKSEDLDTSKGFGAWRL